MTMISQILKPHKTQQFEADVITGLSSSPKYIDSKYLYDERGDKLFQQIMHAPEYYLTNSELEIFQNRCEDIRKIVSGSKLFQGLDLIELGAGDALKSSQLLSCFSEAEIDFRYFPIDISEHIIEVLEKELPLKIPGIRITGVHGEYLEALRKVRNLSNRPKMLLFLGGNIGNMTQAKALQFCRELRNNLAKGDLALIGFDLKKNPWTIFKAYNDNQGITKEFNLNLLSRINEELGGDFHLENFDHFESYDPETGACKSYIISLCDQKLKLGLKEIEFKKDELIFTEISQKYSVEQIDKLSMNSGFKLLSRLYDSRCWFTDVIWECV